MGTNETKARRIVSLTIENVKRISVAHITPDGRPMIVIGGRNGQGKTSVLDAIEYALGGKGAICTRPIRDGEETARSVVDLGDIIVTRTFTAKGSYLQVTNADGFQARGPQDLLDKMVGRLSFDPLKFVHMDAKKQMETLRELVGIDLSDLDEQRKTAYAARTEANRDVKRLRGAYSEMEAPPEGTPETEVSVAALMKQIDEAEKHNTGNEEKRKPVSDAAEALDTARQCLAETNRKIADLELAADARTTDIAHKQERLDEMRADVAKLEDIDTAPIREKVAGAETINRAVRLVADRARLVADGLAAKNRAATLTAEIDGYDDDRRARLAAAEFPVDGLSLDDFGVTFRDVPLSQASGAEQLRVSVAMGLAANPSLRVLLIRDGSLLDAESMALLESMAADADAQVWVERVGDADACAVVIEDGTVRADATETDGATEDDEPAETADDTPTTGTIL